MGEQPAGTTGTASGATVTELWDAQEDELVTRGDIEFVGPEANHKGVAAYPREGWE